MSLVTLHWRDCPICRSAFFLFFTLFFLLSACTADQPKPEAIIEDHLAYVYPNGKINLQNLSAVANCQGPNGAYITVAESLGEDDYLYFHQNFFNRDNFSALVTDAQTVFALNDSFEVTDPLPEGTAFVLKTHEFHKIALTLEEWFDDLRPAPDTTYFSVDCLQFTAKDQWGMEHQLFFDKKARRFAGFQFQNPDNENEKIKVFYKDWKPVGEVVLNDKVDIIQGSDQQYAFDYETIELNKDNFRTLKPKK